LTIDIFFSQKKNINKQLKIQYTLKKHKNSFYLYVTSRHCFQLKKKKLTNRAFDLSRIVLNQNALKR
jgi:hypothetical protein